MYNNHEIFTYSIEGGIFLKIAGGEGLEMQPEYKDLSDKIEGVKDTLGKQMTDVLVKMGEMTVAVQSLGNLKVEVDSTKEIARDAKSSTSQAHKRIDQIETEIKPAVEQASKQPEINMFYGERLTKLETTFKWVATTVIGTVIVAIMGYLFQTGG